ncbi:MAG TPA: 50S ribosomal protein L11 [Candidatus Nanoarchaeia archaeon]|nr:50S ribosomal protein L11 [Candidatus Nanoarchaeia archaeon]
MKIKLIIDAGDMKPGPALSQKLGPLGVNLGKVIQDVNKATASFKGIKVPVEIDVDAKTKNFGVNVFTPPVAELLKKELGLEKGSGEHKKIKVGNAGIEQVISVAKTKMPGMLCKDFKSAVKSVVGSCVSLGILIEDQSPKDIEKDIDAGKYDSEIAGQKTELSEEKRKKLQEYFAVIKAKQDELIKKEEAEKAAKEAEDAAKAATAATAGAPAAGAGAAQPAAAKAPEAKAEKTAKK